jgi:hypothetical protein
MGLLPTRPPRHQTTLVVALLLSSALTLGGRCGGPKPNISITSPGHGVFVTAPSVLVTGTMQGVPVANAEVKVNGVVVPIQPDRTFSTTVTLDAGIVFNPVFAELTNLNSGVVVKATRIVVIAGESVADGAASEDSVALRLNDSGLDVLESDVAGLVDLDLATLLPVGEPVISDFCAIDGGFLGCLGRVDVKIASPPPSFTEPFALDVDSMASFAAGDITLLDLRVDTDIVGSGLAPSCGLRLTADQLDILGDYALEPDSVDPSNVDVNQLGAPGIVFAGFQDEFTSGLCDFPLIGDLIQLIIGDIQPTVTSGLVTFLSDPDGGGPLDAPIADGIETALADISIAGSIGESLGVVLEAPLFKVEEDPDGITLGSDGAIYADFGTGPSQCDPPPGTPDLAASLHIPEAFPTFGATTPGGGVPYGLGICVSSSAFNQLLKAEVECGLLQITLTEIDLFGTGLQPVTAGLLSLIVPEFGSLDPNLLMRIELRPTLAPIITGTPGPLGEIAELRVGGLAIDVLGNEAPALDRLFIGGQIDFRAGLDFSFVAGELIPSIASVQSSDIKVDLTTNLIHTDAAFVEFALQQLLPLLLPSLGNTLGAFPLPSFLGLELQSVAVEQNGEFLSIFVDLVAP